VPDRKTHRPFILIRSVIILVLLSFANLACNASNPGNESGATTSVEPTQNATDPTETPQLTPTDLPGQTILIAPTGSNPEEIASLQATLEELSSQAGLNFQTFDSISQLDFSQDIRIVIVLPPDPGITDIAAANPGTQFVGIGMPGLQASGNLSVIGGEGERPDQQGFIAGYLAAVISEDWRIGVISQSDSASGRAARLGFNNGAIFFCGLCRPVYPPFIQYPQYVEINSSASTEERQSAADALLNNAVKTVYVSPGVGDEGLLPYLAQAGVNLIGGSAPPADVIDHWVATIAPDLNAALRDIWPSLIEGEGGKNLPIPIVITQPNEVLFSPGRQSLVNNTLAELLSGLIDTGIDPLTGELK
jgi:hypothetical protein